LLLQENSRAQIGPNTGLITDIASIFRKASNHLYLREQTQEDLFNLAMATRILFNQLAEYAIWLRPLRPGVAVHYDPVAESSLLSRSQKAGVLAAHDPAYAVYVRTAYGRIPQIHALTLTQSLPQIGTRLSDALHDMALHQPVSVGADYNIRPVVRYISEDLCFYGDWAAAYLAIVAIPAEPIAFPLTMISIGMWVAEKMLGC